MKFEVALEYLKETGEVIWFQNECRDKIFNETNVFLSTIRCLFDHNLEQNLRLFQKLDTNVKFNCHEINQGVLHEDAFNQLFEKEYLKK